MQGAARQLSLFDSEEPDVLSGFSVRESGRAKRLSIKVFPRGRVEVVVPKRTRAKDVQTFVASHADWIRSAKDAFAAEYAPEPFALPDRIALPGIGHEFLVRYAPEAGAKTVRYRSSEYRLSLSGRTGDEALCVRALRRWLTGIGKKHFLPVLQGLSLQTGLEFSRLHVRGQRTCWGSHSSTGTISLNYCLLFLAPEHVRYVMLHELCHARHMNHSKRFWRLVGRYEPDYERLDRELNSAWKDIPTWVGIY